MSACWGQALLLLLGQGGSSRVVSLFPALGVNAERHPGRNPGDLSGFNGGIRDLLQLNCSVATSIVFLSVEFRQHIK